MFPASKRSQQVAVPPGTDASDAGPSQQAGKSFGRLMNFDVELYIFSVKNG